MYALTGRVECDIIRWGKLHYLTRDIRTCAAASNSDTHRDFPADEHVEQTPATAHVTQAVNHTRTQAPIPQPTRARPAYENTDPYPLYHTHSAAPPNPHLRPHTYHHHYHAHDAPLPLLPAVAPSRQARAWVCDVPEAVQAVEQAVCVVVQSVL